MALCRSALYEALALGFRPATEETVRRLVSREGALGLADAAAVVDEAQGSDLAAHVRGLAGSAGLEELTVAYGRLFGHTARGVVPPYETEYGQDSLFQPMHEMSDLSAFYRAFGLGLRPDAHERPDHVSCQCEFLLFLARKEAYALERDERAMLAGTVRATRRFLRDHLGRWAPGFGRALAREAPGGFFGTLGLLCVEFVTGECARVGVTAGPEFIRLRPTSTTDVPAACGAPPELLEAESRVTCPGAM